MVLETQLNILQELIRNCIRGNFQDIANVMIDLDSSKASLSDCIPRVVLRNFEPGLLKAHLESSRTSMMELFCE